MQLPPDLPPIYAKPGAPLEHPDDVMLFLDADMLCVRPLDELVTAVRAGSILAIEDIGRPGSPEKHGANGKNSSSWGRCARRPTSTAVSLRFRGSMESAFFNTLAKCLDRVDLSETLLRAESTLDFSLPFFLVDQDIANAILASAQFRDRVVILPYRCAPHAPFRGIKVAPGLSCIDAEGNEPFFLHHALQKPWSESLPTNPYTELLVKFIHDARAPNVSERDLPLFLRDGRIARAARMLRSVRGHTRAHVRGRLGLRPYLLERARRR